MEDGNFYKITTNNDLSLPLHELQSIVITTVPTLQQIIRPQQTPMLKLKFCGTSTGIVYSFIICTNLLVLGPDVIFGNTLSGPYSAMLQPSASGSLSSANVYLMYALTYTINLSLGPSLSSDEMLLNMETHPVSSIT
jgi:hypothetical protein